MYHTYGIRVNRPSYRSIVVTLTLPYFTLLSVGTRTRRCNQGGITHSPLHMGVSRPPPPSPKGSSSKILPAGIGAIISTLHNCDRCFFYGPDPALTGLYPERGEGGGAIGD